MWLGLSLVASARSCDTTPGMSNQPWEDILRAHATSAKALSVHPAELPHEKSAKSAIAKMGASPTSPLYSCCVKHWHKLATVSDLFHAISFLRLVLYCQNEVPCLWEPERKSACIALVNFGEFPTMNTKQQDLERGDGHLGVSQTVRNCPW